MSQIVKIPNNNKTIFKNDYDYFFRSKETYSDGFNGKFVGLARLDNGFLFELDIPNDYEQNLDYHIIDGTNVSTHGMIIPRVTEENISFENGVLIHLRKEKLLAYFIELYGEEIFRDEDKFKSLMRELQIDELKWNMALPKISSLRDLDLEQAQIQYSKNKLAKLLIDKYNITDIDLSDKNRMKSILREIKIDNILE